MAAYIDYAYYTTVYSGSAIARAEFTALAINASAFVDLITMDRAAAYMTLADPTPDEAVIIGKIKNAVCAVADRLHAYSANGGIISSESVGAHSVTYADKKDETLIKIIAAAAYPFLAHTGLMFRGFNAGEYGSYPILP